MFLTRRLPLACPDMRNHGGGYFVAMAITARIAGMLSGYVFLILREDHEVRNGKPPERRLIDDPALYNTLLSRGSGIAKGTTRGATT
ncbi:hypothetical protein BH23GEM6_BH23GEM6_13110 [soil metagenome]